MPHILIVEDDTDINNFTAEYLRRKGCLCSQAFSGTEGRLLWQAGGIDLLLVDLMLPGLSGSELIGEIRKASRTFLSAASIITEKWEDFKKAMSKAPFHQRDYNVISIAARVALGLHMVLMGRNAVPLIDRDT